MPHGKLIVMPTSRPHTPPDMKYRAVHTGYFIAICIADFLFLYLTHVNELSFFSGMIQSYDEKFYGKKPFKTYNYPNT